MNVRGKTALVTGGGSGLGEATARAIVDAAGFVVIVDLPDSGGARVAKELGQRGRFVPADVRSEREVRSAVDEGAGAFGGVHIVVNCAGVAAAGRVVDGGGQPLALEEFSRLVNVNLVGAFNVIRLAAAQMVRQPAEEKERGVVINTASTAAMDGQIGQSAYAASKAGVVGMTLPLARDLASSLIRVVTIAPGTFDTPMLATLPEPARERLASLTPHPQRLGRPQEFASLVVHVVENPMLNGSVIRLDGALRMPPR